MAESEENYNELELNFTYHGPSDGLEVGVRRAALQMSNRESLNPYVTWCVYTVDVAFHIAKSSADLSTAESTCMHVSRLQMCLPN